MASSWGSFALAGRRGRRGRSLWLGGHRLAHRRPAVALGLGIAVRALRHGELLFGGEHEPVASGGGEVGEGDEIDEGDAIHAGTVVLVVEDRAERAEGDDRRDRG